MNIIVSNRPFKNRVASTQDELSEYLKTHKVTRIYFPFWSWKVPNELLLKCECIGFHSAPLPYGRGGSPIQNMIRLGYKTTQVCMFYMTKNFDGGRVIARREVGLDGTLNEIVERISKTIEDMIEHFESGKVCIDLQDPKYSNVPLKFYRLVNNKMEEKDTLKGIYDEIRMRDECGHPKTLLWHGRHRIDFTDTKIEGNKVTAKVEIYET